MWAWTGRIPHISLSLCVAALASSGCTSEPPNAPDVSAPSPSRSATGASPSEQTLAEWVVGLAHIKRPPAVYYSTDRTLYFPGGQRSTALGSESRFRLAGVASNSSWVVAEAVPGSVSQIATVGPAGPASPFATKTVGSTDDFAISWNGQHLLYQGVIFDIASQQPVGTAPRRAFQSDAWTKWGLVYEDPRGRTRMGDVDGQQQILADAWDFNDYGAGFIRRNGCWYAAQLTRSAQMMIADACLRDQITPLGYGWAAAISPNGKQYIARSGHLIATQSGESAGALFPTGLERWSPGALVWLNEQTVVIGLPATRESKRPDTWLVSCDLRSMTCKRNGTPVPMPPGQVELFTLPPSSSRSANP